MGTKLCWIGASFTRATEEFPLFQVILANSCAAQNIRICGEQLFIFLYIHCRSQDESENKANIIEIFTNFF